MKHIVMMGSEKPDRIFPGKFKVSYFDPTKYLPISEFTYTSNLDFLWRKEKRKKIRNINNYYRLLDEFIEKFKDVDIIVANWFNPFHPEWLIKNFPKTVKIYGCIDDPWVIYQKRVNCLWAFDAAFYVSPSYDTGLSMPDALRLWGINRSYWFPLSANQVSVEHCQEIETTWNQRTEGVIYIGQLYGSKFDRLVQFKHGLGKDFSIYGRWPLSGYAGLFGPLKGRPFFPYRVRSVTNEQRRKLYLKYKIGLNMHLSDYPRETGNMRMYEVPFHGLMLLGDKAANDLHESIFKPDVEAVFYDSIEDAIDKAKYYLKNDSQREKIARAGFARVCRDYDSERCLKDFLEWACTIPLKERN